jgi:peptide deformylase
MEETREMMLVSEQELKDIKCIDTEMFIAPEVNELAQEMIKFVVSMNGVGMTANQIGLNRKFGIFLDDDKWSVIVNPSYITEKKVVFVKEKNINFPADTFLVKRAKKVRAIYYTLDLRDDKLKFVKVTRTLSDEKSYLFQSLTNMMNGIMPQDENTEIPKTSLPFME